MIRGGLAAAAPCALIQLWPLNREIEDKRSTSQNAIGRRKLRPRKPIATLRSASATKNAKVFFCAWPKQKSGTRSVGSQN